jgi:hypothetical protein
MLKSNTLLCFSKLRQQDYFSAIAIVFHVPYSKMKHKIAIKAYK